MARERSRALATESNRDSGPENSQISRRAFLGAAGATAATLMMPRRANAASTPRIAIVGGGISGLTAAMTLADQGFTEGVTVYEASNRIGGRMFSNSSAVNGSSYWDDDQVTEWCGELVDTGHTTVQMLCQRFNLTLNNLPTSAPANSTPIYMFGGHYYTYEQAGTDFGPVYDAIQADFTAAVAMTKTDGTANDDGTVLWNAITAAGIALDNMSIHDWIVAKVPGGITSNMGKLLDVAYASEFGADITQQSALNLVLLAAGAEAAAPFAVFGASDEKFHIHGGNQQLPLAIAADLRTRLGASSVQMNSKLTKIVKNGDGTSTLTFAVTAAGATTNTDVTADAVILAIPFPVMADAVDYSGAGFDARKIDAITNLGRGLCSKLQLQFTSRPWRQMGAWGIDNGEETFSDNGNQCSWEATRGQPGTSGIKNGYSGGSVTMARATTAPVSFGKVNVGSNGAGIATLATTFLSQLEQIFPGVTPDYNGKATLSIPHLDQNMRLSYAYWGVGQYQRFAGYERAPQGNIFFAGEHTSVNNQGFIEGGAAEGIRAAMEAMTAMTQPMVVAKKGGCDVSHAPSSSGAALPLAAVAAAVALRGRRTRTDVEPDEMTDGQTSTG